jgi:hypothetical protein
VSVLSQSHRAARSPWIAAAGRIGLAAQGICFGLIGVLAIGLAAGVGGEATDPQGALDALARHGWARVLIVALAVGFAGYTVWRLAQAVFDRGGMGSDGPGLFRRAIQLVQGIAYGFLTWGAANVLAGATGAQKGGEKKAAAGLLGLPGGRELVDPSTPVGIGGALAKLAHAAYGRDLLGVTAAGLIVFGCFDLLQARFHKA